VKQVGITAREEGTVFRGEDFWVVSKNTFLQ